MIPLMDLVDLKENLVQEIQMTSMQDKNDQDLVRLAAYCALGLSAVNLGIMLMLAMMLLRSTV